MFRPQPPLPFKRSEAKRSGFFDEFVVVQQPRLSSSSPGSVPAYLYRRAKHALTPSNPTSWPSTHSSPIYHVSYRYVRRLLRRFRFLSRTLLSITIDNLQHPEASPSPSSLPPSWRGRIPPGRSILQSTLQSSHAAAAASNALSSRRTATYSRLSRRMSTPPLSLVRYAHDPQFRSIPCVNHITLCSPGSRLDRIPVVPPLPFVAEHTLTHLHILD